MPRSIIVTGASGLIGRAACSYLAERGHRVVGVGRTAEPLPSCADWIVANLEEAELARDVFDGVDAIVHLAAIPSPGAVPDSQLFRNNTGSTFNVLNAAGKAGVPKAVLASSISIYGVVWADKPTSPSTIPLTELSELRISDAYALGKEVDEATARMMARRYGMSIASLRLPNVSTEDDVRERSRLVAADPTYASRELWAYLTLSDAARAIELAVEREFDGAIVANVVSPQPLDRVDVAVVGKRLFPDSIQLGPRPPEGGYSTDVAASAFGFVGTSLL